MERGQDAENWRVMAIQGQFDSVSQIVIVTFQEFQEFPDANKIVQISAPLADSFILPLRSFVRFDFESG